VARSPMWIDRGVLNGVRQHLTGSYPREGCGLLLGEVRENGELLVQCRLPVENRTVEASAHHRYLITPDDFRRAERHAKDLGQQVIGVYHSHPDAHALPSVHDKENAWPWFGYLILSVVGGGIAEERAWRLAEDRGDFIELKLKVKEQ